MTQLGSIEVNHPRAYIEARAKIHSIAGLLAMEPLLSTRVASVTSQLCRDLYQDGHSLTIQVGVVTDPHQSFLVLGFEGGETEVSLDRLALFFERVSARILPEGGRAVETCSRLPHAAANADALARIASLLEGKSRDELLAEIRAKNQELESHRDNLERTVSERTHELELASEKMQASEERTRLLLESVGDGIFGVDITGAVNFINQVGSEMLGFAFEELLSQKVHVLIHHTRADGTPYPVEECPMYHSYTRGEAGHRDDEVLWRKDGTSFPVEYSSKPVMSDGKLHGSVVVFRDITERKRAESALAKAKETAEAATKAKGYFLANMSHEIRTPMNAIIGLSELCLRTSLNPKQQDYLNKVHASAVSLLGIINDILDFSKIEAGKLDIESIPFDLDQVLDNLATVVSVKTEEKGLELLFARAPEVPSRLVGDPLRLGQILTNLANNAVKFTEEGEILASIDVQDRSDEQVTLRYAIKDSGIGMTEQQVGRLFQSFSQADTSTTRKYGGTGLGLAISKQLVEMMDGRIWVESEVGEGSTFAFDVVLGIGEEQSSLASRLTVDLEDLNVLVVDDNPHAREILKGYLEQFSFRVATVGNAAKALELLKQQSTDDPFRLVMMDFRMPGMDGLTATRHIKTDLGLEIVPKVILATAHSQAEVAEGSDVSLLDNVLSKPVNPSLLLDVIMEAFGHEVTGAARVGLAGQEVDLEALRPIQGARILLTEDNLINQQVATEFLEQARFRVDLANHGREALEKLEHNTYDCVLMDIQMPVMDGYTATRRIREQDRFRDLPILAMTANAMVEDREEAEAVGMNGHIAKPIDPKELFSMLVEWIEPGERELPEADAEASSRPEDGIDELPDRFPGIDIEAGLKRIGGNRTLFRKLLMEFRQDHGDDIAAIRDSLTDGDAERGQRLAHTIKGVAATIGAEDLQLRAKELEVAIKEGNKTHYNELIEQLELVMEPVVQGLSVLAETQETNEPAGKDIDLAEIALMLDRLKELIEEMDPDAEEKAQALQRKLSGTANRKLTAQLLRQVSGFEFEDALETLAQLQEDVLNRPFRGQA